MTNSLCQTASSNKLLVSASGVGSYLELASKLQKWAHQLVATYRGRFASYFDRYNPHCTQTRRRRRLIIEETK